MGWCVVAELSQRLGAVVEELSEWLDVVVEVLSQWLGGESSTSSAGDPGMAHWPSYHLLKAGILPATMPDAWRYRVSAGTGLPIGSIL